MPITPTYIPLGTITLASTDSEIVFSSIPATYRDLIVVMNVAMATGNTDVRIVANSDSSTSYSFVQAFGDGASTGSSANGSYNYFNLGFLAGTSRASFITQIMDYSATDKHKTALTRFDNASQGSIMLASRYASTTAINSLAISPASAQNWTIGSTFSLYGVN